MKKIVTTYSPLSGYWIGSGLPVRTLFSYDRMGANNITPFCCWLRKPDDWQGPFVMNTEEEIQQAIMDFLSGKFGLLNR